MRQLPRGFAIYRRAVSSIGVMVFVISLCSLEYGSFNPVEALLFMGLVFYAELVPTKIPETDMEITVTVPIVLGIFLSHGAAGAIAISAIPILAACFVTQRGVSIPWLFPLAVYNTANHTIAMALASLGYLYAGGEFVTGASAQSLPGVGFVLRLVLWATLYSLSTGLVCATASSLYRREPWRLSVQRDLKWSIPDYVVSVPFAILFVSLYVLYGMYGIVLLVIPFLVARQALNLHARHLSTYRETITALGVYIQHHHLYTLGHLERVASLSEKIARQMQLAVASLMYIKDAGLLHDIGKVGVDEAILDKTGQLSEEDWTVVKQHPARGAEILAQMKYLECTVPWVRSHHERPDGRGYPDGLQDGQIPIEAAVIAVADAYDAMTGGPDEKERRVYRAPLTVDQAVDQVRYGAGSQFDSGVVKAFLTVMAGEEEESGA